jgi:hypothetical protein
MDFGLAAARRPGMTTKNFVDELFTTSPDAAFTNAFDVKAEPHATPCLCRAGNAD